MCRRGVCYATVCGAEMSWRVLFWHNVEPNLLKNSREHSAAAVREHIRPALAIMLYIYPRTAIEAHLRTPTRYKSSQP
jgi:hypothetical protein